MNQWRQQMIPDNSDLFDQYEAEQERKHRMLKRLAAAEDVEEREDKENEFI